MDPLWIMLSATFSPKLPHHLEKKVIKTIKHTIKNKYTVHSVSIESVTKGLRLLPLAELQLFWTQIHSLSDPVQDEVVFALHHLVLTLYVQALQLLSWSQSWAQAHSESTVLPLTTSFPLQMKPIFLSQTKNKKKDNIRDQLEVELMGENVVVDIIQRNEYSNVQVEDIFQLTSNSPTIPPRGGDTNSSKENLPMIVQFKK